MTIKKAAIEGKCVRQFNSKSSGNFDAYQRVTVRNQVTSALAVFYSGVGDETIPITYLTCDSQGKFSALLEQGKYKFEFGDPVQDSMTIEDVQVFDPSALSIDKAPSDGTQRYRSNGAWVTISEFPEAPVDGQLFARSDQDWETFNELHYPNKVGDVYRSNTGNIDIGRDLPLTGGTYNVVDWSEIAGTVGYPIDSVGVDSVTYLSSNTLARVGLQYVNGLIVTFQGWTDDDFQSFNSISSVNACANSVVYQDKVIGIEGSNIYQFDSVTKLNSIISSSLYSFSVFGDIKRRTAAISESNGIILFAGDNTSELFTYTIGLDSKSAVTLPNSPSGYSTVGFSNSEFYITQQNTSQATLLKTSDFVSYTEVSPIMNGNVNYNINSANNNIYATDVSAGVCYKTSDGLVVSKVITLPNLNGTYTVSPVLGINNFLLCSSKNNSSTDYYSKDDGDNWSVLPSSLELGHAAFNESSSRLATCYDITSTGQGDVYDLVLSGGGTFTTPNVPLTLDKHNYYVRGKT